MNNLDICSTHSELPRVDSLLPSPPKGNYKGIMTGQTLSGVSIDAWVEAFTGESISGFIDINERYISDFSVNINRIGNFCLSRPLSVVVRYEDGEYIANAVDISEVYGSGETSISAVAMLKDEILSLYEDLNEDDNFADNWQSVKQLLKGLFRK